MNEKEDLCRLEQSTVLYEVLIIFELRTIRNKINELNVLHSFQK